MIHELAELEAAWTRATAGEPGLAVIWGRRVGETCLLTHFAESKRSVYFTATRQDTEGRQLRRFTEHMRRREEGGPVNEELDDDSLSAKQTRLLVALGRALGRDPMPELLSERAEQLLDLDSVLVELIDQAATEPAGMRGETVPGRLEFATGGGSVAVALADEPDRLRMLSGPTATASVTDWFLP